MVYGNIDGYERKCTMCDYDSSEDISTIENGG